MTFFGLRMLKGMYAFEGISIFIEQAAANIPNVRFRYIEAIRFPVEYAFNFGVLTGNTV